MTCFNRFASTGTYTSIHILFKQRTLNHNDRNAFLFLLIQVNQHNFDNPSIRHSSGYDWLFARGDSCLLSQQEMPAKLLMERPPMLVTPGD